MRAFPTATLSPNRGLVQPDWRANPAYREPVTMLAENGRRTIRTATADACASEPSVYCAVQLKDFVDSEEALYRSARKCRRGVGWKYSTQAFFRNLVDRICKLAGDLRRGKYRDGLTHAVNITFPKKRTALAISFRDRVRQRSLNDYALYPQVVRHFIYANMACQKGKGTDAARRLFKAMLRRAFIKYGHTAYFQILACDIKGYYDSMRHDATDAMLRKYCDAWTASEASRTLDMQYKGATGYSPGSQMVQIAGIAYLSKLDHFVKERMRRKLYIRYMDDFYIFGAPGEDMGAIRRELEAQLAPIGMRLHAGKTRVLTGAKGADFLGFTFRATDSGKVLMFRDPAKVKTNCRKLRRLARLVKSGKKDKRRFDLSFQSIRSCAALGSSRRLLRKMDDLCANLKQEMAS